MLAAVFLLSSACSSTRTVLLKTERPAVVYVDDERICDASPCPWTFSRETCSLFDSSLGYVRFLAETTDENSKRKLYASPMYRLCALKRNEHITIRMQPDSVAPEMPAPHPP